MVRFPEKDVWEWPKVEAAAGRGGPEMREARLGLGNIVGEVSCPLAHKGSPTSYAVFSSWAVSFQHPISGLQFVNFASAAECDGGLTSG